MSDLKELVAMGDSTIFPGYTLSPPRLIEFAEAEQEAAAHYLRRVAKAAAALSPATREAMQLRAVDNFRGNAFGYGSPAFDDWAMSLSAAPFLAWLLLRIKHPALTLPEASQFLCGDDQKQKLSAVWSMWGYTREKKAPPAMEHPDAPPSTGGESSRVLSTPSPEGSD